MFRDSALPLLKERGIGVSNNKTLCGGEVLRAKDEFLMPIFAFVNN